MWSSWLTFTRAQLGLPAADGGAPSRSPAVRRALAADAPPKYVRPAKGSAVDAVEPQIRGLLADWPTMPATVIAERIGWQRSLTVLKDRVRQLRGEYLPPDPASRTSYSPGELAGVRRVVPAG